jgi:hypothetical protein
LPHGKSSLSCKQAHCHTNKTKRQQADRQQQQQQQYYALVFIAMLRHPSIFTRVWDISDLYVNAQKSENKTCALEFEHKTMTPQYYMILPIHS